MAPHVENQVDVLSPPIPPKSRLSLDSALGRGGILGGGWWPHSRDAGSELPNLISLLNPQVGVVVRLGVDARDWDDIPRRMTVGGHRVGVGWFADLNHKIIVTRGPQDHILLLVVPPHAATDAAESALTMASIGRRSIRPEEILASVGIQNEARADPPRAVPEEDDHPREPGIATDAARPMMTEDARRGEIGRRLDDGAPSRPSPRSSRADHV
ncbi:hypothetical protein GCM10023191_057570 [Actinoallomurus oryzae]|uniref:Uncharacterized protein n=1 Tax=Actinoallomurus oryzae TaxID=502180 RepID=A0ABP8QIK2_9ACTN